MVERIFFAGGCLWGVQAYIKTLKGVIHTEAGRANGGGGLSREILQRLDAQLILATCHHLNEG